MKSLASAMLVNSAPGTARLQVLVPLAALTVVAWAIYVRYLSKLSRIPGPLLARYTAAWELYQTRKGVSHDKLLELHRAYGPVVRIGPNRYSFNRVEDMKVIYARGSKFMKSEYYDSTASPHRINIFNVRNATIHLDRRRKIASLYTVSTMISYEPAVDRMTTTLSTTMTKIAAEKRWVSMPALSLFYAFDVIGDITLGRSFGMVEQEQDSSDHYIETIRGFTLYFASVGLVSWLHKPLMLLSRLTGVRNGTLQVAELIGSQVTLHRDDQLQGNQDPKSESFAAKLVQLEQAGKISTDNTFDSMGANLAAGSDTTGISLGAILYYLYRKPEKLAKLRTEIDTGEREGRISDPVTYSESQEMPYLQAVIKESLRIHPAVGAILPRSVPQGGAHLAGYDFPQGTQVGVSAWVVHRDSEAFGPDPDTFRPERWLETEDTDSSARNSMFFAFGGGSRACIGKNISMLELSKVVPQIVRKFDLHFEATQNPWHIFSSWFVWPEYNCRVTLRGVDPP